MKAGEGVWQTFVVTGEATEASHPAEAAFDDPTPGQEDEAAFGFGCLTTSRCMPWASASAAGWSPV